MKKVLIALNASADLFEFIKQTARENNMMPIDDDSINVRKLLLLKVDEFYTPDDPLIVVMSDRLMSDVLNERPIDRDAALLQIISELRNRNIRVIFLCLTLPHRKEGDAFLGELVGMGVWDIWYKPEIDKSTFTFHFSDDNRMLYRDVEYLRRMSKGMNWAPMDLSSPASPTEKGEPPPPTSSVEPEIIYKEKIVEVEKVVERIVRVNESVTIQPRLIVVGGLNRGSGTSTIAALLGFTLKTVSNSTVVIEAYHEGRYPQLIEFLGQENCPTYEDGEQHRSWRSWIKQIQEEEAIHDHWEQHGLRWAPLDEACPFVEYTEEMNNRLINSSRIHTFVIVDIGDGWHSHFIEPWLLQADQILCVSDCSSGRLTSAEPPLRHIVNRYGKERVKVCLNHYSDCFSDIKDGVFVKQEKNHDSDQVVEVNVAFRLPNKGTYFSECEWKRQPFNIPEIFTILTHYLQTLVDERAFLQPESWFLRFCRSLFRKRQVT